MLAALGSLLKPDDPFAFTVNVYGVPVASPVTVIGDEAPEAVNPPGEDVAVYEEMPDGMPVLDGAINATDACCVPAIAVPIVGAPGFDGHVPAP